MKEWVKQEKEFCRSEIIIEQVTLEDIRGKNITVAVLVVHVEVTLIANCLSLSLRDVSPEMYFK